MEGLGQLKNPIDSLGIEPGNIEAQSQSTTLLWQKIKYTKP
jgi:hypothetical protein